jgi:hypothetical protein
MKLDSKLKKFQVFLVVTTIALIVVQIWAKEAGKSEVQTPALYASLVTIVGIMSIPLIDRS